MPELTEYIIDTNINAYKIKAHKVSRENGALIFRLKNEIIAYFSDSHWRSYKFTDHNEGGKWQDMSRIIFNKRES